MENQREGSQEKRNFIVAKRVLNSHTKIRNWGLFTSNFSGSFASLCSVCSKQAAFELVDSPFPVLGMAKAHTVPFLLATKFDPDVVFSSTRALISVEATCLSKQVVHSVGTVRHVQWLDVSGRWGGVSKNFTFLQIWSKVTLIGGVVKSFSVCVGGGFPRFLCSSKQEESQCPSLGGGSMIFMFFQIWSEVISVGGGGP